MSDSPLALQPRGSPPVLQQFRIGSPQPSPSSEIEVCVEPIVASDTESQCCSLLLGKCAKQKCFSVWRLRALQRARPRFDGDELRGIRGQAYDSATAEYRRQRLQFLGEVRQRAAVLLGRIRLSSAFLRWKARFDAARRHCTQTAVALALDRRKTQERAFHQMRTAQLRRDAGRLSDTGKSYAQLSHGDRLRELLEELQRSEHRNECLETDIQSKSRELAEWQTNLRRLIVDVRDVSRRLKEVRESTAELQRSFAAAEQRYQEEIGALRAELSLEGGEEAQELEAIDAAVRAQQSDRRADYAFADDAQASALLEIEQHEEQLRTAEKVVKSLEEMLHESQGRQGQLAKARSALADEIAALRMKKGQLESRLATNEILGANREEKMQKLLQEANAQLEAANARIDGQSEQIKSKQREIELLQEDIRIQQKGIASAQSRFFHSVSPKQANGKARPSV
jgi:chromosome segregation ATPase